MYHHKDDQDTADSFRGRFRYPVSAANRGCLRVRNDINMSRQTEAAPIRLSSSCFFFLNEQQNGETTSFKGGLMCSLKCTVYKCGNLIHSTLIGT